MSLEQERNWYREQDIATTHPGYIRIAQVDTYDNSLKLGTAILDNATIDFKNLSSTTLQEFDLVPVALVDQSLTYICFGLFERP